MSYYLFLDDERQPWDVTWVSIPSESYHVVRNYMDFVATVRLRGIPQFVSFDHDLADSHYGHGLNGDRIPYEEYQEWTGYHAAKWLVDHCHDTKQKFPDFVVHSMNPVGKENIETYIALAKRAGFII